MKNSRIGILLLVSALLVFGCTGCFRNRDKNNGSETTSDSSLIPSPGMTLPGEDGTTVPQTDESTRNTTGGTQTPGQQTTTQMQESTTSGTTTTQKNETTTKKPETTTKVTETTTKKPETTTRAPETTTKTPETTTRAPETTTRAPETTTKTPETTTAEQTTVPNTTVTTPNESITLPMPDVEDGKITEGSGGSVTTPGTGTTAPEVGAGEWLHFEDFRDSHAGAAAYLGRSATEMPVTELITYFGLPLEASDITVIDRGESEDGDADAWYLILPRYRDTVVRIREAEQTTRRRTRSGELIAEGMHPMLLRCDPEEGVYVELIHGEETISFSVGIDKESGKPTFHDRMLDITPEQMTR